MTRSERIKLYNAIAGLAEGLDELKGKEIELSSAVVAETQWADDYGNMRNGHKVWLILKDGTGHFSGSSGIASSLYALETFMGSPPWTPALKVTIHERSTNGGKRYYFLSLADDPRDSEPARPRRGGK